MDQGGRRGQFHPMEMEQEGNRPAGPGSESLSIERGTLMVVVILIATLTFQIGTNPPGGLWQDDLNNHTAGRPIMRDKHHHRYLVFSISNWLAFSLSVALVIWLLFVPSVNSLWFKIHFAFCIATLVFVYLAVQAESLLRWAVVTGIVVFLVVAVIACITK